MIPGTADKGWFLPPNPELIGMSEPSVLPDCLRHLDFTYFQVCPWGSRSGRSGPCLRGGWLRSGGGGEAKWRGEVERRGGRVRGDR